ncbi:MAG: c-type cytochrome [Gammaproteobacteria bacterium]|nr:c-type cytochrome [Gammaproteobacteria bacterium]
MRPAHVTILASLLLAASPPGLAATGDGAGALPAALAARAQSCAACHGPEAAAEMPIIGGQHAAYLYLQMRDYQSGNRADPRMAGAVDGLDRDQLIALARHFAADPWPANGAEPAGQSARQQARSAISAGECSQCHLGGFKGDSRVPRLAGQREDYLHATLLAFKHGGRSNSPAMADLMAGFSDEEIAAMAAYLAGYRDDASP